MYICTARGEMCFRIGDQRKIRVKAEFCRNFNFEKFLEYDITCCIIAKICAFVSSTNGIHLKMTIKISYARRSVLLLVPIQMSDPMQTSDLFPHDIATIICFSLFSQLKTTKTDIISLQRYRADKSRLICIELSVYFWSIPYSPVRAHISPFAKYTYVSLTKST